jgi:hypothetical protein
MFIGNWRYARILFVFAPLALAACASTGDLRAVKAESDAALAAANRDNVAATAAQETADQSKSTAQQALATAQQALKSAQQAQANATTASAEANRMYQRELAK